MSLATVVSDLATRVGTEAKALRTLINGNAADLSALTTTDKTNLVAAINELEDAVSAASGIDDGTTGLTTTWSSTKIASEIDDGTAALIDDVTPSAATVYSSTKTDVQIAAATAALVDGSPGALDTLNELAAALADDAAFSATIATALGNRVRTDTAAQGLNGTQMTNARTNIDAASATNVGNTATNFVTVFEAALV